MNFKISTKEKFREIYLLEPELTANMTDDLVKMLKDVIITEPRNVVLSLKEVNSMDHSFAENLTGIQTMFYDEGASFVICEMQQPVEDTLEASGLLETMNIAPTLSEAWDILQMEEIERELLDGWEE
jgi:anti-anti-sigma factor